MIPGPTLTFAFIIATLFGAVFHIIVGGDAKRLALFLLSGWIGFGLGQFAGILFEIDFFPIGELLIIPAALGAVVALLVAHILTNSRPDRRTSR
jgi:uncharacterized membrane protein YeaQ/YmgE (transglycosylase-associated protein family)